MTIHNTFIDRQYTSLVWNPNGQSLAVQVSPREKGTDAKPFSALLYPDGSLDEHFFSGLEGRLISWIKIKK